MMGINGTWDLLCYTNRKAQLQWVSLLLSSCFEQLVGSIPLLWPFVWGVYYWPYKSSFSASSPPFFSLLLRVCARVSCSAHLFRLDLLGIKRGAGGGGLDGGLLEVT